MISFYVIFLYNQFAQIRARLIHLYEIYLRAVLSAEYVLMLGTGYNCIMHTSLSNIVTNEILLSVYLCFAVDLVTLYVGKSVLISKNTEGLSPELATFATLVSFN